MKEKEKRTIALRGTKKNCEVWGTKNGYNKMPIEINPSVIGITASGICVLIILGLLKKSKAFSYDRLNLSPYLNMEMLDKKYHNWLIFGVIQGIFFSIVSIYLWYKFFNGLANYSLSYIESSKYIIFYCFDWIFIPSFLLGMCTSILPINFIYILIFKNNYEEFYYYADNKINFGINSRRLFAISTIIFLALLLIFMPFSFNFYTRFTDKEIVINRFLSFGEESYHYTEIKDLRFIKAQKAPNGNIVKKPHYEVAFKNGIIWSTTDYARTPKPKHDNKILNFLSRQTGLNIDDYITYPRTD